MEDTMCKCLAYVFKTDRETLIAKQHYNSYIKI